MLEIPLKVIGDWKRLWRAAGPARVAEGLTSNSMDDLIDEAGPFGAAKRDAAKDWRDDQWRTGESDRKSTNTRPWIAASIAVVALLVAIAGLIFKRDRVEGPYERRHEILLAPNILPDPHRIIPRP